MSAISMLPPGDPNIPPPKKWDPSIRLSILTPIYPLTDCRWTLSLPGILQHVPPGSTHLADWRYGVAEARESLLHTAMVSRPDLTHILFLDGDVIPDQDSIWYLFQHPEVDIVSGIYFNSLLTGLAAWREGDGQAVKVQEHIGRENPLMRVQKVGMGLCLIKIDVFKKMEEAKEPRPFFYYMLDARNNQMQSEDFYFFSKCLKYNIQPHIDFRARATHLKMVSLTPEGAAGGGIPQCKPGEHYDPLMNRCVPDSVPAPTDGQPRTVNMNIQLATDISGIIIDATKPVLQGGGKAPAGFSYEVSGIKYIVDDKGIGIAQKKK